jgi:hypothetical protein
MSAVSELAKLRGQLLFGMPRAAYDAEKRIHWSTLKEMGRSPMHYAYAEANPRAQSDAMKLGDAGHVAILEPQLFVSRFAHWDGADRRTKEGKAQWSAFEAANKGKTLLEDEDWTSAHAMRDSVMKHPAAAKYLQGGDTEVSMLWDFVAPAVGALPGFRFELKGRIDLLSRAGAIVDLKSTRCAEEREFQRQCVRLGYFGQAALYSDGYHAITGTRLPYVIIAVESAPPHPVNVFEVHPEALAWGRDKYITHLAQLEAARASGVWGGYADTEVSLTLPRWARAEEE